MKIYGPFHALNNPLVMADLGLEGVSKVVDIANKIHERHSNDFIMNALLTGQAQTSMPGGMFRKLASKATGGFISPDVQATPEEYLGEVSALSKQRSANLKDLSELGTVRKDFGAEPFKKGGPFANLAGPGIDLSSPNAEDIKNQQAKFNADRNYKLNVDRLGETIDKDQAQENNWDRNFHLNTRKVDDTETNNALTQANNNRNFGLKLQQLHDTEANNTPEHKGAVKTAEVDAANAANSSKLGLNTAETVSNAKRMGVLNANSSTAGIESTEATSEAHKLGEISASGSPLGLKVKTDQAAATREGNLRVDSSPEALNAAGQKSNTEARNRVAGTAAGFNNLPLDQYKTVKGVSFVNRDTLQPVKSSDYRTAGDAIQDSAHVVPIKQGKEEDQLQDTRNVIRQIDRYDRDVDKVFPATDSSGKLFESGLGHSIASRKDKTVQQFYGPLQAMLIDYIKRKQGRYPSAAELKIDLLPEPGGFGESHKSGIWGAISGLRPVRSDNREVAHAKFARMRAEMIENYKATINSEAESNPSAFTAARDAGIE